MSGPERRGTVPGMRLLAGPASIVVALAVTTTARAQTPDPVTVALDWRRAPGAESCVDRTTIEREVEARLGRHAFVARDRADVVVDARLSPLDAGAGFQADLSLQTTRGQSLGVRDLRTPSADCAQLDESLSLVIALMVDIPRADLPPLPPVEAPPPAAPRRTTPIRVPERRREPWRVEPRLGGSLAVGLLPGIALGAHAGLALEPPLFWRTEIDGTIWRGADATDGSSGSRFELTTIGLRVCPVATRAALRIQACVGQRIGWIQAQGFGFDEDRSEKRLFYTVSLLARAGVPIAGPLALQAGMGLDLPVTRDHFTYTRADGSRREIFRMAAVVVEGELGLAIELP